MKPRDGNKVLRGFTLVEVVVALIILLVTAAGVMSSFVAVRRYVTRAKRRTVTASFARQEMEKILRGVRQDTWGVVGNPLVAGNYDGTVNSQFAAQWGGALTYTVQNVGANTAARRVTANIAWDEPDAQ